MPRINPESLLKCLHALLNKSGGILGSPEVVRMVTLMRKFSNTLVSKVCYVLILKETEDELLAEFMAEGGWGLVFQWLGDAITSTNNPFIKEILQLLIKCPINLERLKESNAPRTVKALSKDCEDIAVKALAQQIVEKWLNFIKSSQVKVEVESQPVASSPVAAAVTSVPSLPRETTPPPQKSVSVLQPFKIVIRDGKRVLLNVNPDSATPPKVKRTEKTHDVNSESPSVVKGKDTKHVKVRDTDSSHVRNSTENDKIRHKTSHKSDGKEKVVELKKKDSDSRDKSDKKEHSKGSSSSSNEHKSHKSSSSHSKSSKDLAKDKSKVISKSKHREHSSKDSRDKFKELQKARSRDKDNQKKFERDSSPLDDDLPPRTTPAISSLGKIPKKTSSSTAISAAEASATGGVLGSGKEPVPLPVAKKGTYSDERKRTAETKSADRPKTVKTLPTKFRSTGLEEEPKPPPSRSDVRKKDRKEEASKDPIKRVLPVVKEAKDVAPTAEKKPRPSEPRVAEIKDKLEKLAEKPGGIKLIPPKPKPVLLESDMFSDALTASSSKEPRKKKRRTSSSTKDEVKKEAGETSPKVSKPSSSSSPKASSPTIETKPLKFYRDTLDEAEAEETKKEETEAPRAKLYPEGVLVVHRSRKAPRKSVKWRSEAELVSVQYFELDETERVNVSRSNFNDSRVMEHKREAQLLHKMAGGEATDDQTQWGPLFVIDVPTDKQAPEAGLNSTEKDIQLARQKTVLEAIFFHKSMIPDSPVEPDVENHPMTDPKPIPLEDASGGKDATYDYSATPWPEPKPDPKAELDVMTVPPPNLSGTPIPTYTAPGYSSFPSYSVAAPETWRTEENKDAAPNMTYPPGAVPMAPQMYGMPPYVPPPGGLMGPDGFNMGMYPPNGAFPMAGGFGPMGPMGPPGWGPGSWRGPRGPPLPLEPHNICRAWSMNGACNRGNMCRFLHPGVNCPPLPTS